MPASTAKGEIVRLRMCEWQNATLLDWGAQGGLFTGLQATVSKLKTLRYP